MSEHGDWTERAVSEELREVALVARSRGFTLRGCAKKIGVRHTTALQHLRAVKPRRETVERWKGGLGISDADILSMRAGSRAQRVDARYLTVKRDAVIRISREVWKRAMGFALRTDRELREVVGAAVEEYVARESGVELGEKEKHV